MFHKKCKSVVYIALNHVRLLATFGITNKSVRIAYADFVGTQSKSFKPEFYCPVCEESVKKEDLFSICDFCGEPFDLKDLFKPTDAGGKYCAPHVKELFPESSLLRVTDCCDKAELRS